MSECRASYMLSVACDAPVHVKRRSLCSMLDTWAFSSSLSRQVSYLSLRKLLLVYIIQPLRETLFWVQEEAKQRKKKRKADTRGKSLNEVLPAPKNQSSTMGLLGGGTGSVSFLLGHSHSMLSAVSHALARSIL